MRTQRVYPDFLDKGMRKVILLAEPMENLRFDLEGGFDKARIADLPLTRFYRSHFFDNKRAL